MDNWKESINGNKIDTDYFIDCLVREIMSGKGRGEIISGIEKECDTIMKPYTESLNQWEEKLKYLENVPEDEIHREYDKRIVHRMKSYEETLKENRKTIRDSKNLLERISGKEVSKDFRDVFSHILDELQTLTRKNEYITEQRDRLAGGKLEYDETYEWFKDAKFNETKLRINRLKKDISDYERIKEDKIRFINKVFDELNL